MNNEFWVNVILYVLIAWSLFWKGVALWRAAHLHQRNWFVFMIVFSTFINTIGLLEFIYLFWFAKKRLTIAEIKTWKNAFVKKVPEHEKHRD